MAASSQTPEPGHAKIVRDHRARQQPWMMTPSTVMTGINVAEGVRAQDASGRPFARAAHGPG
jgi:hypothetical protein